RLRRDTIRVEERPEWPDRLSLHRLPAKRWRALYHVGVSAPRRSATDERRSAQDRVRGSDSLVCRVLRNSLALRGQQRFRYGGRDDRVARRPRSICAAENDLARRQIAVGYGRRIPSCVPKEPENFRHVRDNSTLIF